MSKAVLMVLMSLCAFGADNHPILPIGAAAPDFSLPGVDGKTHSLGEYANSPVLAIVFTCNHCPTAQMYEDRIRNLADDYRPRGVALVAINPNDPSAMLLAELRYSDVTDSFEDMKIRASYRHFDYPYLYDGATQEVAEAYGPQATPHIFIFDRQRKLRYEGRIDDSMRESLVKIQDARIALDAVLAGKPVPVEHRPVFGCSTKWRSKEALRRVELLNGEKEPVQLEPVDADGLKTLRRNPTGKVLLVNFWAASCGTCITDLVATYRMYRQRDFDFVAVATNTPDEKAGVLKELARQHASNRNLQFASSDRNAMEAAFGAHWDAGVPFTMLIAPDGKVLYRKQGKVDIVALRRVILANLPDDDYIGHRAHWARLIGQEQR